MPLVDYSTTAGSNVSISGIGIGEGMAPGDVNGAFRQFLADMASFFQGGAQAANVDLATAAGVTNVLAAASNHVTLTGSAGPITSFGTATNRIRFVRVFGGGSVITHNSVSLSLPGNQNITTADNDSFLVVSNASGNSKVLFYQRGDAGPLNGQITFPSTQVPSANGNVLDDYEEGSFTPIILGATFNGVGTYVTQNGRYTKVGRIVTYEIHVQWSGHTGTGQIIVAGFPFTVALNSAAALFTAGLTFPSGAPQAFATSSGIYMYYPVSGGASGLITLGTTGQIITTCTAVVS